MRCHLPQSTLSSENFHSDLPLKKELPDGYQLTLSEVSEFPEDQGSRKLIQLILSGHGSHRPLLPSEPLNKEKGIRLFEAIENHYQFEQMCAEVKNARRQVSNL